MLGQAPAPDAMSNNFCLRGGGRPEEIGRPRFPSHQQPPPPSDSRAGHFACRCDRRPYRRTLSRPHRCAWEHYAWPTRVAPAASSVARVQALLSGVGTLVVGAGAPPNRRATWRCEPCLVDCFEPALRARIGRRKAILFKGNGLTAGFAKMVTTAAPLLPKTRSKKSGMSEIGSRRPARRRTTHARRARRQGPVSFGPFQNGTYATGRSHVVAVFDRPKSVKNAKASGKKTRDATWLAPR